MSLLFTDQTFSHVNAPKAPSDSIFALPSPLGGLAGEVIHGLSLGIVYTFANLLTKPEFEALQDIKVIGVGDVTNHAAVARMRKAGASVVGCKRDFVGSAAR